VSTSPEEIMVKTWHEIARYTPFAEETLRKNYGRELVEAGVVFFVRLRKNKTVTACAYISVIKRYFALRKWI